MCLLNTEAGDVTPCASDHDRSCVKVERLQQESSQAFLTEFLTTGLMFLLNLKTGSTNQIIGLLMFEKTCGADTRETEGKSSSS